MGFHELGQDFVFAHELGFELLDLVLLRSVDGLGLTAVLESQVGVLEELALPLLEEGRIDLELVAQVGDGGALEEVALDDGDLLVVVEMTSRLVHKNTSVQVMLTRTG